MVNAIRVVGHVDDEVARRVQRAVVPVAAAVHLREAAEREEQGGEDNGVDFHKLVKEDCDATTTVMLRKAKNL